jgi:L-2-hydroxyglutarate oxidase LhgO
MFDVAICGGGIIGLATARALLRKSSLLRVVVLEKDAQVGQQQSSHSSNVLHSGIYYTPGSERARLCFTGKKMMEAFCIEHKIPFNLCGKLIVATEEEELPRLKALFERGKANQVPRLELLEREDILKLEPNLSTAIGAIYSPETGIVDYGRVTQCLAEEVQELGGEIRTDFECRDFEKCGEGKIRISGEIEGKTQKEKREKSGSSSLFFS